MRYRMIAGVIALQIPSMAAMAVEETETYPGTFCQTVGNTQVIARSNLGPMFNAGTVPYTFICPINKDDRTRTVEHAQIVVTDTNTASNVSCTLYVRTVTGAACGQATQSTAALGPAPGIVTLQYAAGAANFPTCSTPYYWLIECFIPPVQEGRRSGVISYGLTENIGEN